MHEVSLEPLSLIRDVAKYPLSVIITLHKLLTHNIHEWTDRVFKVNEGVEHITRHVWPLSEVRSSKVKVRSHAITRQLIVLSTSNMVKVTTIERIYVTHFIGQYRSNGIEVEIWLTFSLFNAKMNWKRAQIAPLSNETLEMLCYRTSEVCTRNLLCKEWPYSQSWPNLPINQSLILSRHGQ